VSASSTAPATATAPSSGSTAAPQLTAITGSATEDVFGNSITVSGYAVIPGSAFPAGVMSEVPILDGGSVLVAKANVTAATTKEYSVTGFPDTLTVGDAVSPYGTFSAQDAIVKAVEAMGFAPVTDPASDGVGEGYLITSKNHPVKFPVTITMKRWGFKVSDGSKIDAQTWTVATITQ